MKCWAEHTGLFTGRTGLTTRYRGLDHALPLHLVEKKLTVFLIAVKPDFRCAKVVLVTQATAWIWGRRWVGAFFGADQALTR
jgi:hypothetical protein